MADVAAAQREYEAAQAVLDGGGPETVGGAATEQAALAQSLMAAAAYGGGARGYPVAGTALEGYSSGINGAMDGPLLPMFHAAYDGDVPQLLKLIGVHGRDPNSADERSFGAGSVSPPACLLADALCGLLSDLLLSCSARRRARR